MVDIRRRGKVPYNNHLVDAELIDAQKTDERWSVYELDDGSTLRFRAIVTEIWRIIDQYDAEGNPIYVIKSQNVLAVTSPDEIKRRK